MIIKKIFVATILPLLLSSCAIISQSPASHSVDELAHNEDVYEIIAHLYRWHLDEIDIQKAIISKDKRIWIRDITPDLDPGDNSRFAEIILPNVGVKVTLKKSDYTIEKAGLKVSSNNYKITRVNRIDTPKHLIRDYVAFSLDRDQLREYLFTKRGTVKYPEGEMMDGLRAAVRNQIKVHLKNKSMKDTAKDQAVHFAPLSPVANELWAFWEGGRMLVHFSSDIDIHNPYVWENDVLSAVIYDIDEQVVVSLQEVPGSNAYMTRDQVGRALYNCVVLGKRVMFEPKK